MAVLAVILLLSFMITRFMDEAVDDLEYRAIFNEPTDVRSFAYSMLEVALATVQEVALIDEGKLYAREQGWGNPIAYAGVPVPDGWEVQVNIADEGGKLPLNTMSEELLNRLLEEELEFDFGTARELSSSLLDWIDPDSTRRLNGAESEDYLRRDPPYRAANRPLQSLDELRLVNVWDEEFFDEDGQPNELFTRLSDLVSVINTGPVNLNAAPAPVLDVLALQDGFQDDAIFDGLEQPYLKTPPAAANTQTSGTEVGLLRITVRVQRGSVPFILTALVEPNFDGEGGSSGASGDAPGSDSGDAPKTGALSEQEAINYPFTILQLSEYTQGGTATPPARDSAIDIAE